MDAVIEDGRRRHEKELIQAQQLVEQARSGTVPEWPGTLEPPLVAPPPGEFRVEFHWRGETATYVEHDRRAQVSCAWWGGPKGSVAHQYGVWESDDGVRAPMTAAERVMVLERVIERAASHHGVRLEPEGA
jgi:hypothetical protein